jgi:hypothetical protein
LQLVASRHYQKEYVFTQFNCLIETNVPSTIDDSENTTIFMQDEEDPTKMQRLGNKQLLIQNVDYAIDMFLIYVLTLSIFPGFLSEDTGSHRLGSWYVVEHNYMIIFCALVVKNV